MQFYDTFTETARIRHWVPRGSLKTLCGREVKNGAPDKLMRRLDPCAACSRRIKERATNAEG